MVRKSLVERQTIERMMAASDRGRGDKRPPGLPPEQERAIVHQGLADHYGRILDESISALGDTTPRKAVRSAKGRDKVVAWLKMLENHSAQQPADDPIADYDFGWMWEELGLGDRHR